MNIEENVTILQEVKAADKINVLAEIELNESYSENDETEVTYEERKIPYTVIPNYSI